MVRPSLSGAAVALIGHAHPLLAGFRRLHAAHIALALVTALMCLRLDTRPAPRRA
jgi:hypothetical protein